MRDDAAIEDAIAAQAREPGGGLIILPDSFVAAHSDVIIAAATRHSLPLIGTQEFPSAGNLMSYWVRNGRCVRTNGVLHRPILNGTNPADLPVQQPTKVSLNLA